MTIQMQAPQPTRPENAATAATTSSFSGIGGGGVLFGGLLALLVP